ncbi:MAG TPA: FlgO family outer membrane protein [Nitrospirota bacterium]|nr:FlgO family outer membrane protein [Nitrospirota bacterium]
MRRSLRSIFKVFIASIFIIMSGSMPFAGPSQVYAGSEALADQVVRILSDESAREKIKVIVLDFHMSFQNADRKPSEGEIKELSSQYTEEFIADIVQRLSNEGKQSRISIIDRSKLDDILRGMKPQEAAAAERTATELGTLAGADVVVTGSVKITGDAQAATVKAVRVKDGEILGIAKQDVPGKPPRPVFEPITVIDEVEKIEIGALKALPMNLEHTGTLHVAVDVVHGNPMDVIVIEGGQLEHLQKNEKFDSVPAFKPMRTRHYKQEAPLEIGSYYLVLKDSSVGIFAKMRSEIKVTVRLEP